MRSTTLIAAAILGVLALSVGALAYPVVVHPAANSKATAPAAPTTVGHPTTDDNSTENETTPTPPPPPELNETENETGNTSVEHNVTVTHDNGTTWINGTIVVTVGNETVVNLTFSVRVNEPQGANVTFDGTILVNGTEVHVNGTAMLTPETHTIDVHGTMALVRDGITLDTRAFAFQLVWLDSPEPHLLAMPLPGLGFDVHLENT